MVDYRRGYPLQDLYDVGTAVWAILSKRRESGGETGDGRPRLSLRDEILSIRSQLEPTKRTRSSEVSAEFPPPSPPSPPPSSPPPAPDDDEDDEDEEDERGGEGRQRKVRVRQKAYDDFRAYRRTGMVTCRFSAMDVGTKLDAIRAVLDRAKKHNLPHIIRLLDTELRMKSICVVLCVEGKANVDKCKGCGGEVKGQSVVRSAKCQGCRYHVLCAAILVDANGVHDFDECYGRLMGPCCRKWVTKRNGVVE